MKIRAQLAKPRPGKIELIAWAAGLACLTTLVLEVVHRSRRESEAGFVGSLLVFYVVYTALSVRSFWTMPRVAIPITLIIGGGVWTLALHSIERSDESWVLASTIFVPLAMVYALRLLFPETSERDHVEDGPPMPSLVHSLLDRGMGFGDRPDRVR